MEKKKPRQYHVSALVFCTVWQKAKDVLEVSRSLGMPVPIVFARASRYRCRGVALKIMPRRPLPKLNVEELNRHLEDLST